MNHAIAPKPRARTGFTLVEMLVVIGIIVLLIGLLLPMLTRAYRNAERTRVAGDLQAISAALEAYKQDMNQYPPVPTPNTGAIVLCQALLGPGDKTVDGADGFGFRPRMAVDATTGLANVNGVPQTKVYGPYMPPDRIKITDYNNPGQPPSNLATAAFMDRYRHPILYFPANPSKPNPRIAGGYVAQSKSSMFDARDNLNAFNLNHSDTSQAMARIQLMLGDTNKNGMLDAGENPRASGLPYLLWSTGPDELYGPDASTAGDPNVLDIQDADKCDDVTNFRD